MLASSCFKFAVSCWWRSVRSFNWSSNLSYLFRKKGLNLVLSISVMLGHENNYTLKKATSQRTMDSSDWHYQAVEKSLEILETFHKHLFNKLKTFSECPFLAVGFKEQIFAYHWWIIWTINQWLKVSNSHFSNSHSSLSQENMVSWANLTQLTTHSSERKRTFPWIPSHSQLQCPASHRQPILANLYMVNQFI